MCTDIPRANCQAPCNDKEYLKLPSETWEYVLERGRLHESLCGT